MSSPSEVVPVAVPDRSFPDRDTDREQAAASDDLGADDHPRGAGTSPRPRRRGRQVRQDADGRLIFRL